MCPLTWSGWRDLNPRPLRPERSALPSCATPRACRAIVAHRAGRRAPGYPHAGGSARDEGQQDRLGPAGEPDRRGRVGAEAGRDVQPGGRSRASGAGPWPSAGPGRSWSPARPTPGTQTWPPWVWPASSRSKPSAAMASSTRGSGEWVTPMCTSASGRPGRPRRRSRRGRRAGRRRRPARSVRPPALSVVRALLRSAQPAPGTASRSSSVRQVDALHVLAVLVEVAERVLEHRAAVVVGAEDERARVVEAAARRRRTTAGTASGWAMLSPVTTTRSGSRPARSATQRLLALLARGEVQVGDVQHAQRLGVGRQHRHVEAAQGEQVALDQGGVGQGGRAGRRRGRRPTCGIRVRAACVCTGYGACTMSTLKAQLESDLRDAMKARDELVTSTLRMAIAAVRTAEVAGKAGPGAQRRRGARRADQGGEEAPRGGRRRSPTPAGPSRPTRSWPRRRSSTATCRRSSPTRSSPSIVADALAAGGFTGEAQMGPAMKAAQAAVAGRAEGGRVAAEVRRQLG